MFLYPKCVTRVEVHCSMFKVNKTIELRSAAWDFRDSFLKANVSSARNALQRCATPGKGSALWSGLVFLKCREALMRWPDARAAQEVVCIRTSNSFSRQTRLVSIVSAGFSFYKLKFLYNGSEVSVLSERWGRAVVWFQSCFSVPLYSLHLLLWDVFLPNVCTGLIKHREDRTDHCRMSYSNLLTSIWVSFFSM